jgi:DNA-binding MarR family transcriptional regulator
MRAADDALNVATTLHRSATRLSRRMRARRHGAPLSLARLGVLGRLHREGGATAAALAGALGIQPQSLTRLLAELERKGLISRRPDAEDRRQSLIAITPMGKRLLLEDVGEQRALLASTMAAVLTPAEQEMLRLAAGLMERLSDALEVASAAAP